MSVISVASTVSSIEDESTAVSNAGEPMQIVDYSSVDGEPIDTDNFFQISGTTPEPVQSPRAAGGPVVASDGDNGNGWGTGAPGWGPVDEEGPTVATGNNNDWAGNAPGWPATMAAHRRVRRSMAWRRAHDQWHSRPADSEAWDEATPPDGPAVVPIDAPALPNNELGAELANISYALAYSKDDHRILKNLLTDQGKVIKGIKPAVNSVRAEIRQDINVSPFDCCPTIMN